MNNETKLRTVYPWSFLWRNTKAYYCVFSLPINKLTEKAASNAVKIICANVKKLEARGIKVYKYAKSKGKESSAFKI